MDTDVPEDLNSARRPSRHALRLMVGLGLPTLLLIVLTAAQAQNVKPVSPKADTVATGAKPGNAENGKRLFTAAGCYECHGYAGQGGSAGPKLGPHPISFPAFVAACRHPREMPPYTGKVISDAQLADIYAFVQSLPEPPNVDSVPLLKGPE